MSRGAAPADLVARFAAVAPPLAADFDDAAWHAATTVVVDRTSQGAAAPADLATTARLIWTANDLWIGFACRYTEIDADTAPDVTVERDALWERDVCEAFVQSPREPHDHSYKELEIAPTGQWCDLAIHRPRVDVDLHWQSGMRTAAVIAPATRVWRAVMQVPFTAFGATPRAGETWRANLFRISRWRGERQFLAYAPTGTATPDFHLPGCFVPLRFSSDDPRG